MASDDKAVRNYLLVFGALILLTAATVGVAYVELGRLSEAAKLSIATGKALLVALYFMHVRDSSRLVAATLAASIVWLMILIGFTMSDVLTREWLAPTLVP